MEAPKSNWCFVFVFVVMIVMVAGFSGSGIAQQTPSATANTTATTDEQDTQVANGTTTNIETSARSPTQTAMGALTPTPDANDGWENATPIGPDRAANGTLPVGDQDWHVFSVESSERITVRFVAGNQTNMSSFLYGSGGKLLDSSYVGPGEQVSLTGHATSSGSYYVFVRNEATDTPGAYAFTVSVAESPATAEGDQLQPEADVETETSSEGGPGFGVGAGLVAVVGAGALLSYLLAHNSSRPK